MLTDDEVQIVREMSSRVDVGMEFTLSGISKIVGIARASGLGEALSAAVTSRDRRVSFLSFVGRDTDGSPMTNGKNAVRYLRLE